MQRQKRTKTPKTALELLADSDDYDDTERAAKISKKSDKVEKVRVWWPPTRDKARTGFSGAYWPATVLKKGTTFLTVQYDNGEQEKVDPDNIFPIEVPIEFGKETVPLAVGEFVEVSNNSKTDPCAWLGKIATIGKKCLIDYPFHDSPSEYIKLELLRRARVWDDLDWKYIELGQKWKAGEVTSPIELNLLHEDDYYKSLKSGSSKSGKGKRAAAAAAAAADAASEDAGSDEEEGSSQEEEPQPKKQQRGRPRKSQHPSRAVLDEASNGSNEKDEKPKGARKRKPAAVRQAPATVENAQHGQKQQQQRRRQPVQQPQQQQQQHLCAAGKTPQAATIETSEQPEVAGAAAQPASPPAPPTAVTQQKYAGVDEGQHADDVEAEEAADDMEAGEAADNAVAEEAADDMEAEEAADNAVADAAADVVEAEAAADNVKADAAADEAEAEEAADDVKADTAADDAEAGEAAVDVKAEEAAAAAAATAVTTAPAAVEAAAAAPDVALLMGSAQQPVTLPELLRSISQPILLLPAGAGGAQQGPVMLLLPKGTDTAGLGAVPFAGHMGNNSNNGASAAMAAAAGPSHAGDAGKLAQYSGTLPAAQDPSSSALPEAPVFASSPAGAAAVTQVLGLPPGTSPAAALAQLESKLALLDHTAARLALAKLYGGEAYLMLADCWRANSPRLADALRSFMANVLNAPQPDYQAFMVGIFGMERMKELEL